LGWAPNDEARSGTMRCEKPTCTGINGQPAPPCPADFSWDSTRRKGFNGDACAYTFPGSKRSVNDKKWKHQTWCAAPKTLDTDLYKGQSKYDVQNGIPQVCTKFDVLHVNEMSRSAGVLMVKRSSCLGKKCSVYKAGLCIDLCPDCTDPNDKRNIWSSAFNDKDYRSDLKAQFIGWNAQYDKSKTTMKTQREDFARHAVALLKKHNNRLPAKYQCSDERHPFMYQKALGKTERDRKQWHHWQNGPTLNGKHEDATLAYFTILKY